MKVLILSGRFGFGHEMAANAVKEELKRQDENAEIIQKDLPGYFYPHISKIIYKVFGLVAERYHRIYNLVYRISERMNSKERPGGPIIFRKFQKMMEEYMPDMIVCTHPFCGKAAATYKAKTGSQVPLVTCITDISVSMEWFTGQTDIYLAPTVEIKEHLTSLGVMPEDIFATGIPVRRQFLESVCESSTHENSICESSTCENSICESSTCENNVCEPGLCTKKEILIMGGGLGIMPGLEEILHTLHDMPGVKTTVITGNNRKLYKTWAGHFDDVEVLGYVENIGDYMKRADLVITKAGGITLFESIHSKVPMFMIHPFLEQEITNARYAQKKGFAEVIWEKDEDFLAELRRILDTPGRLEEMQECMIRAQKEMMDTGLDEAVRKMKRRAYEYLTPFSFVNINKVLFGFQTDIA